MGSPINPLGGKPTNSFEKYYEIQAIDNQNREDLKKFPKTPPTLGAYVLFLLKKVLYFVKESTSQKFSKSTRKGIQTHIMKMKDSLKILTEEDKSQDILFLKNLSHIWQNLLEDSLELKKTTPLAVQFKNFIKQLAFYPEEEEYSLAYYLSEYAGRAWLPFPYMELIQKLHTLSQNHPNNNPLHNWIISLEKIITLLNQE